MAVHYLVSLVHLYRGGMPMYKWPWVIRAHIAAEEGEQDGRMGAVLVHIHLDHHPVVFQALRRNPL